MKWRAVFCRKRRLFVLTRIVVNYNRKTEKITNEGDELCYNKNVYVALCVPRGI